MERASTTTWNKKNADATNIAIQRQNVMMDRAVVEMISWEMDCTVEVGFNVINYLYQDHGFIYRFVFNPGPTCSKQS